MGCEPFEIVTESGETIRGIMCSRGHQPRPKCIECGQPAPYLCDFPVGTGKTCDKPLCGKHRRKVSRRVDYCLDHPISQEMPTRLKNG